MFRLMFHCYAPSHLFCLPRLYGPEDIGVGVGLLVLLDNASPCRIIATGSDVAVMDTGVGDL